MEEARVVRVVLASPGDVAEERKYFREVIAQANHTFSELGILFDPRMWEDTSPGFSPDGAQEVINKDLKIEKCDLLVGIFSRRPGRKGADGEFITESEIRMALNERRRNGSRPEVMVYFFSEYSPRSLAESEDRSEVLRIQEKLRAQGAKTFDYVSPEDFRFKTYSHLVDYVIRGGPRGEDSLECNFLGSVPTLRADGYTELIEDVPLDVFWARNRDSEEVCTLTLVANTNITNRTFGNGLSDIALKMRDGDQILASGRIVAGNSVEFAPFSLAAGEKTRAERTRMVITGIRVDAKFLGMSSTSQRNYVQAKLVLVREAAKQAITKAVILASVEMSFTFRFSTFRRRWTEEGSALYAFTVSFSERFSGAFKTKHQERGDRGTVLVVSCSNLLEGFRILTTARDIPNQPTGTSEDTFVNAIAVRTDARGMSDGPAELLASPVWPGGIAMVAPSEAGLAAWEIVAPSRDGGNATRDLTFGFILAGPLGNLPSGDLSAALAPILTTAAAHNPSTVLPIPRFATVMVPLHLASLNW